MHAFAVDYTAVLGDAQAGDIEEVIAHLAAALPDLWLDQYAAMCAHEPNVLQFTDQGVTFLFDFASGSSEIDALPDDIAPHDRVVAAFGRSVAPEAGRDAARMRGFPAVSRPPDEPADKGHFAGHSLGGGLDANLFPQHRETNRGWSPAGKTYRRMERYCAAHPGTFFFSRPIYVDHTWRPRALEYGVLRGRTDLWVERFPN